MAHATGSYGTPTGTNATIKTDATQSITAPPNAGAGPSSINNPTGGALKTVTSNHTWTWTPDGPLANDPAPHRNVDLSYEFVGGPVQSIVPEGGGLVKLSAFYMPHHVDGTIADEYVWNPVASDVESQTYSPPGGIQHLVIAYTGDTNGTGFLKVLTDGTTLMFNNQLLSRSTSRISAYNGATTQAQFNGLELDIKGATLITP